MQALQPSDGFTDGQSGRGGLAHRVQTHKGGDRQNLRRNQPVLLMDAARCWLASWLPFHMQRCVPGSNLNHSPSVAM
jgi:hypothetical protein